MVKANPPCAPCSDWDQSCSPDDVLLVARLFASVWARWPASAGVDERHVRWVMRPWISCVLPLYWNRQRSSMES